MKQFTAITASVLTFAFFIPAASATFEENVPHIIGGVSNPNNTSFQVANYSIKLHVTGRSLLQLSIGLPTKVRLSNEIKIIDKFGKKLNSTVSLNGQSVLITFAQPVAPGTTLTIDMQQVETPDNEMVWHFPVIARLEGISGDIPMGAVRVQPHIR
mgnify:CR=1 FL=1